MKQTANVRFMRYTNQNRNPHTAADGYNAGLAYLMAMLTLGYTAIHYIG
jgi:hypothetical protein